ncbi:MAG TPA: flagellar biosynthetic protein FliO [Solirubrobacteraceae bacterium]|jgi:flagellar protein FliO/FliZ
MTISITPTRAVLRAAIPALGIAALAFACPAQGFTPTSKGGGEATPLNINSSASGSHSGSTSTAGPSLVRTIVGLVIVIAVIWGLTWILRQVKTGRVRSSAGSGLTSMATLPLGSGRTLHLVRAGRDYLLLGSAEHGVVPIYRYTEQQALETGLLDLGEEPLGEEGSDPSVVAPVTSAGPGSGRARAIQIPGQARTTRAPGGPATIVERLREWTVRR